MAREAMKNAYSKYSGFSVGAALLTKDEKVFTGCNIENISYGLTMCAERVALFKAVSAGYKSFKSIAISSSGMSPTFPCGACRQVLSEFGNLIVYVDKDKTTHKLDDLLPNGFSEDTLGSE